MKGKQGDHSGVETGCVAEGALASWCSVALCEYLLPFQLEKWRADSCQPYIISDGTQDGTDGLIPM